MIRAFPCLDREVPPTGAETSNEACVSIACHAVDDMSDVQLLERLFGGQAGLRDRNATARARVSILGLALRATSMFLDAVWLPR